jgi:hypothetical protein
MLRALDADQQMAVAAANLIADRLQQPLAASWHRLIVRTREYGYAAAHAHQVVEVLAGHQRHLVDATIRELTAASRVDHNDKSAELAFVRSPGGAEILNRLLDLLWLCQATLLSGRSSGTGKE